MFKKLNRNYLKRLFSSIIIVFLVIITLNYETFCAMFTTKDGLEDNNKTSFRLTDIVCSYVEKLYVNPDRIKPEKMLQEALIRLEKTIPELLVDFDETSGTVSVNVDNKSINLNTKNIQTLKDTSSELKKAFAFIAENKQTEKISTEDIMYEGLNGMLNQLDPHTVVLPPKDFNEFKIGTSGQFGGLGMVVGIRDGILTVISPIEGTPADRAGLKTGDQIIEIDGESTITMTLSEAVSKLRGKPNTFVTISVIRNKAATPETLSLEREIIKIPTVDDQVLEDGIGYIKIRNFQNDTSDALREHIENLKENNRDIKGMIIDLRNNSGGLLDQAIQVTDQFIDSGNIVVTVGPGGINKDIQKARKSKSDELNFPIVLLINSGSASGAEIVVGALKENNRGIVIGNRSFGKGTVQQLIDLVDGAALKLTMAKYLTPLFNEVQSKGITPDILFSPVTISDENIDLFKDYSYIREEDILKHESRYSSTNPKIENEKTAREIKYLLETEKKTDKENEDEDPDAINDDPYKTDDLSKDRLVQFAKLFIKHTQKPERNAILEDIMPFLKEIEDGEEKKISKALEEIGIDWSNDKPKETPEPIASLSFESTTNQSKEEIKRNVKRIKAGEKFTITVNVSNSGKGTMYRTRGITESENIYLDKLEFIFGNIKSSETKSYTKTIDIPKNAIDREDEITIRFSESNGYAPVDLKSFVRIESLEKPRFAYSYQISDKSLHGKTGNNDELIQKKEDILLTLMIKNIGKGTSEKTSVSLRNVSEEAVFVEKGREEIGELRPGETKTANMEFKVKEDASFEEFNIDVLISESTFGAYTLNTLTFQITESNVEKGDFGKQGNIENIGLAMRYVPPSINLNSQHMGLLSDLEEFVITGNIDDDKEVKSVYAFVNDEKIYYKSRFTERQSKHIPKGNLKAKLQEQNDNNKHLGTGQNENGTSKSLDFSTEILLKDGPNTVTIVAMDNEGLVNSKSLVITKRPPNGRQGAVLSGGM